MPELFVIRTEGGPNPGERIVGEDQYPWPLPGIISGSGTDGKYFKVREEYITIRTAYYVWRTTEQIQEALNA